MVLLNFNLLDLAIKLFKLLVKSPLNFKCINGNQSSEVKKLLETFTLI